MTPHQAYKDVLKTIGEEYGIFKIAEITEKRMNHMNFTRKHTYYTLIDTTKDVLIGIDPYLQGQTEVFYTREDAQFGKMEYINECLGTLDEGENRADCKAILQEMVKVLKIRY